MEIAQLFEEHAAVFPPPALAEMAQEDAAEHAAPGDDHVENDPPRPAHAARNPTARHHANRSKFSKIGRMSLVHIARSLPTRL